jgi:hypothetical protein
MRGRLRRSHHLGGSLIVFAGLSLMVSSVFAQSGSVAAPAIRVSDDAARLVQARFVVENGRAAQTQEIDRPLRSQTRAERARQREAAARERHQRDELSRRIQRAVEQSQSVIAGLSAQAATLRDPDARLELNRRLEQAKQEREVELLRVQADFARENGRLAQAQELDRQIAAAQGANGASNADASPTLSSSPIEAALLAQPDIVPYAPSGWYKSIVPRPTGDATPTSVSAPASLIGGAATYLNLCIANLGDAPTGFEEWNTIFDGVISYLADINQAPGGADYYVNLSTTVPGGRHVLGQIGDATNSTPESNENNNADAHQWVWQPLALAQGAAATGGALPDPTGGTQYVPSGESFYTNQAGVRASAPAPGTNGFWLVSLRPTDTGDADLRLYRPSTGPTNGFVPTSSIAFSGYGPQSTEFAWWKLGSPSTPASMDVGIVRGFPGPLGFRVENQASNTVIAYDGGPSTVLTASMGQNQATAPVLLTIGAAGAGHISIEMNTSVTGGLGAGLHVALISLADTAGTRSNALANTQTMGGDERLERTLAAGNYGLVIYRDSNWEGMGPADFSVTIRRTPPELVAGGAPGWYAPSVPYKSGVGSPNSAPTVLDGNVNNTIFAYSYSNTGPSQAIGFNASEYIDGQLILTWTPGPVPANSGVFWMSTPRNVPGGLHTMGFKNDVTSVIDEFNEGDNDHASQWVWSPLPMTLGVPVTRPTLPDPQGGWNEIPAIVPRYANVDGLRSPQFAESGTSDGMWGAVALTPTDAATNPDLRVSTNLSTGPSNGFRSFEESSARGADSTDVVVVDSDNLPKTLDVSLYKKTGNASVKVHAVSSVALLGLNHVNTYGPFSLGPDSLIALFNFPFSSTLNDMHIYLVNSSGNANLDFMLFDRTDPTRLYNLRQAVATAAAYGNGGPEQYSGPIPAYAGLAVVKAGSADVGKKAVFQLVVGDITVGVDDVVPARIAFAPITPNPAVGEAVMRFDLPREMAIDLVAYDIEGRRVSTLANGAWNAGRHAIHWTTMGDEGRPLPNGMYFVRFSAGGYRATQRVLVVR